MNKNPSRSGRLAFPGRPVRSTGGRLGKANLPSAQSVSRREFVRSSGRNLAVGGLAVLGLVLGRRAVRSDAACTNRGVCGACSRFDDCGLPRALAVRRAVNPGGTLHG